MKKRVKFLGVILGCVMVIMTIVPTFATTEMGNTSFKVDGEKVDKFFENGNYVIAFKEKEVKQLAPYSVSENEQTNNKIVAFAIFDRTYSVSDPIATGSHSMKLYYTYDGNTDASKYNKVLISYNVNSSRYKFTSVQTRHQAHGFGPGGYFDTGGYITKKYSDIVSGSGSNTLTLNTSYIYENRENSNDGGLTVISSLNIFDKTANKIISKSELTIQRP